MKGQKHKRAEKIVKFIKRVKKWRSCLMAAIWTVKRNETQYRKLLLIWRKETESGKIGGKENGNN